MSTVSAENNHGFIANNQRKVFTALLLLIICTAVIFSALNTWSIIILRPLPYCLSLAILTLLFSGFLPKFSLLGFIILLPILGNKPGTPQAIYLTLIASSLILGIALNLSYQKFVRGSSEFSEIFLKSFGNPILTFSFFYILASILSLSSLPAEKLAHELHAQLPTLSPSLVLGQWYYFISLIEDKIPYPILSVLFSIHSLAISFLAFYYIKISANFGRHVAFAFVSSLLISVIAGLLDYYQVIDLRVLRQLDPVVNPNNTQFRLQSFYGHSGWYAEFIILSAPFIITLLGAKIRYYTKAAIVVGILLLVQFALILTFQRGGWISMPFTLVVIWAFIFITYQTQRYQLTPIIAFKKCWLSIFLSLPLTLFLAVVITWTIIVTGVFKSDREIDFGSYIGRFTDIQRTDDRSSFIRAGILLGALNPFFGAGSESFCIQFKKEFTQEDGVYYHKYKLPLHGTAHNVFLQTFSGKGLVGLVLLLTLLGYLALSGLRALKDNKRDHNTLLILIAGSCFAVSFVIYGMVQEIFYIQSLQILVFLVFGLIAGHLADRDCAAPRVISLSLLLIMVLFIAHLFWIYAYPAKPKVSARTLKDYGCYGREVNAKGKRYFWCNPKARQSVAIRERNGQKYFYLKIKTEFLKDGQASSSFRISSHGSILLKTNLKAHRYYRFRVVIPESLHNEINERNRLKINLEHDSYFIPHQVFKTGDDFRVLSFQLY